MLNENTINERIAILDADISKVTKDIQALDQKKMESTNLLNALMGAKQQCESFLKEFNNDDQKQSKSAVGQ